MSVQLPLPVNGTCPAGYRLWRNQHGSGCAVSTSPRAVNCPPEDVYWQNQYGAGCSPPGSPSRKQTRDAINARTLPAASGQCPPGYRYWHNQSGEGCKPPVGVTSYEAKQSKSPRGRSPRSRSKSPTSILQARSKSPRRKSSFFCHSAYSVPGVSTLIPIFCATVIPALIPALIPTIIPAPPYQPSMQPSYQPSSQPSYTTTNQFPLYPTSLRRARRASCHNHIGL